MANFDTDVNIQPSYGVQKISSPKNIEVQFGDGYLSRNVFGLNQNKKTYNITWKNITETESDTIETFLDARSRDSASFTYTPPQETTSSQYVCKNWSKTISIPNRSTITATFEEVFQP